MNEKILLVDDDPAFLEIFRASLTHALRDEAVQVDAAGSAGMAYLMLQSGGPYAVVVSDYHMPDADGLTLLTGISRIAPHTLKIMLTGQPDLDTAMAAINISGVFGFFAKSGERTVLVDAIRRALARYREVTSRNEPQPSVSLTREEIDFLTGKK